MLLAGLIMRRGLKAHSLQENKMFFVICLISILIFTLSFIAIFRADEKQVYAQVFAAVYMQVCYWGIVSIAYIGKAIWSILL